MMHMLVQLHFEFVHHLTELLLCLHDLSLAVKLNRFHLGGDHARVLHVALFSLSRRRL